MPPRSRQTGIPLRRMVTASLLALACACGGGDLSTLTRPVFLRSIGDSTCSSNLALEAHHEKWLQSDCFVSSADWGWKKIGTAPQFLVDQISASFDALPAPGNVCPPRDPSLPTVPDILFKKLTSEGDSTWTTCFTDEGLPPRLFDEALAAMDRLLPGL